MATLLEQALAQANRKPRMDQADNLPQKLDLAIAYAEARIAGAQVRSVLGGSRQNAIQLLGTIFTNAWRAGLIQKTPKE